MSASSLPAPKITAVIITWNSRGVVEPCVESLFAHARNEDIDVVVVDNASDDPSYLDALESRPRVRVVRNQLNEGYAKAANKGLLLSDSEYCLILNPDIRFCGNPFPSLFAEIDANPTIGAIAPVLHGLDGLPQTDYYQKRHGARHYLLHYTVFARFAWARALSGRYFLARLPRHGAAVLEQIPGAFLLFRRDLFTPGAWMEEAFFLWMEDVDFCTRVRKAGKSCAVVAHEFVIHEGGASFRLRSNGWRRRVFTESYLTFLNLHCNWRSRAATLTVMMADACMRSLLHLGRSLVRPEEGRPTGLPRSSASSHGDADREDPGAGPKIN